MRIEKQMMVAFAVIAVLGGLSIFTLPFRHPVPEAPESGITTEPCTLDEQISKEEEIIYQNKAYLDGLLAQAMEEQTATVTEPETELNNETLPSTEAETETAWIYQPVDSMMETDRQAWVYAYSLQQAIDPYVIMAICERESGCIPEIIGDNGKALGIMQIQPVWIQDKLAAHGYTEADLLMAEPNITIGIEILQDFLGKGRGIEWALTAYRYGPQQANACSTSDYSAWILSRADELRRQYEQR